jgi:hypothetical protein
MAYTGPVWRDERERQILAEVYRSFATSFDKNKMPTAYQQWFRGAGIVDGEGSDNQKTLVINCNYRPFLVLKEVNGLAQKYGMRLKLQEVDKDGNPISNG